MLFEVNARPQGPHYFPCQQIHPNHPVFAILLANYEDLYLSIISLTMRKSILILCTLYLGTPYNSPVMTSYRPAVLIPHSGECARFEARNGC